MILSSHNVSLLFLKIFHFIFPCRLITYPWFFTFLVTYMHVAIILVKFFVFLGLDCRVFAHLFLLLKKYFQFIFNSKNSQLGKVWNEDLRMKGLDLFISFFLFIFLILSFLQNTVSFLYEVVSKLAIWNQHLPPIFPIRYQEFLNLKFLALALNKG